MQKQDKCRDLVNAVDQSLMQKDYRSAERLVWNAFNEIEKKVQVAAREQVAKFLVEYQYATGHGDTIRDLLVELHGQALKRGARAVSLNMDKKNG